MPNETSIPIQYSNNLSNPNEDSLRLTSASTEIPENVLRHRGHSSVPAVKYVVFEFLWYVMHKNVLKEALVFCACIMPQGNWVVIF